MNHMKHVNKICEQISKIINIKKRWCTQCPPFYRVYRCFHKPTELKLTLSNSVVLNSTIYHALSKTQTVSKFQTL